MAYKNYDMLSLQQKVNEIDNKCEKDYVDEKVNDINANINTNINSINSSLEEKANKDDVNAKIAKNETDIATQAARIDTFTSLAEGSTTGDAELIDIRVGADGIKYSNAGTAVRSQIDTIKNSLNTLDGTLTEILQTGVSTFYLLKGETCIIDVLSVSGTVNVFTTPYVSGDTVINSIKANTSYEFTASKDGYINFYSSDSTATISASIKIKNNITNLIDDEAYNKSIESLFPSSFKYLSDNLAENVTIHEGMDFTKDALTGTTITDYSSKLTSSTSINVISPFQIRSVNGKLNAAYYYQLGVGKTIDDTTRIIAEYDKSGKYLRQLTYAGFLSNGFSNDAFYAMCRIFTKYEANMRVKCINLPKWFKINADNHEEYHVGECQEYTTFTACIRALKNNKNIKTIYVHSGTYDIFQEIGGEEYTLSITSDAGDDWRSVCDVIPPNTHVIGLGKVIFNFLPNASQMTTASAHLISPINVSGSCTIENITINADNCRYGIHDETSGLEEFTGSVKRYKNVIVNKSWTDKTLGNPIAYGCGFDNDMTFEFEQCQFNQLRNTAQGQSIAFHNRGNSSNTRINIKDCILTGTGHSIKFGALTDDANIHDKVFISGTYMENPIEIINENSSNDYTNPFDITLLGCSDVAIEETVTTNPYTPKIYKI